MGTANSKNSVEVIATNPPHGLTTPALRRSFDLAFDELQDLRALSVLTAAGNFVYREREHVRRLHALGLVEREPAGGRVQLYELDQYRISSAGAAFVGARRPAGQGAA
jgi:hypothetical protein